MANVKVLVALLVVVLSCVVWSDDTEAKGKEIMEKLKTKLKIVAERRAKIIKDKFRDLHPTGGVPMSGPHPTGSGNISKRPPHRGKLAKIIKDKFRDLHPTGGLDMSRPHPTGNGNIRKRPHRGKLAKIIKDKFRDLHPTRGVPMSGPHPTGSGNISKGKIIKAKLAKVKIGMKRRHRGKHPHPTKSEDLSKRPRRHRTPKRHHRGKHLHPTKSEDLSKRPRRRRTPAEAEQEILEDPRRRHRGKHSHPTGSGDKARPTRSSDLSKRPRRRGTPAAEDDTYADPAEDDAYDEDLRPHRRSKKNGWGKRSEDQA